MVFGTGEPTVLITSSTRAQAFTIMVLWCLLHLGTGSRGPTDPLRLHSPLHSHGVWLGHGFGGPAAAFGASFLQLPEA